MTALKQAFRAGDLPANFPASVAAGQAGEEMLTLQQETQEGLYRLPYHFIPNWDGSAFTQVVDLHWGYEYLSYTYYLLEQQFTVESLRELFEPLFTIERIEFLNRHLPRLRALLHLLLHNRIFVFREPRLMGLLFRQYRRHLLYAEEYNCRRIFLQCRRRKFDDADD